MRYHSFPFILVFILIIGCSENSQLEDPMDQVTSIEQAEAVLSPLFSYQGDPRTSADQAANRGNAVTRPLKLRSSGTITYTPNAAECDGFIHVLVQGEGLASLLGRFIIEITYCSDGVNPISPITGVQTAANGDQLFTALVGAGEDPEKGPYQDYIYYGGTGRFDGATGEIRLYVQIDPVTLTFKNRGMGTLTF